MPGPSPGLAPQPPIPEGQQNYETLLHDPNGGVDVANAWASSTYTKLVDGGMKPSEAQAYLGRAPFTPQSVTNAAARVNYTGPNEGIAPGTAVATNPAEEFQAGWERTGLGRLLNQAINGGKGDPNVATNPKSGFWGSMANVAGATVGDVGPSLVGAFSGSAAVIAAGGGPEDVPADALGVTMGAGAGASAAPTAFTHAVIDAQHQGKDLSWQDVASQVFDSVRDGAVGALTLGAGKGVGKGILDKTGSKVLSMAGELGTQAIGQATIGAAAHGRLPTKQDFTAAIVGTIGTHLAFDGAGRLTDAGRRVQRNLQEMYKDSNGRLTPDVVAQAAAKDPSIRDELLNQDIHGDPVTPTLRRATGDAVSFQGKPTQPGVPISSQPEFQGGVDRLLHVIGGNETGSGPTAARNAAVSNKGALGMFQIEPGTARHYGFDPTQLHDQAYNTHAAQTIIGDLYRRSGGDEAAVLVGYDAGPGRMHEYLNSGPGTRLEAIRDNTVHGGWRYEKVSAVRDESFLPLETQKYVAQGRVRGIDGGKGGAPSDGSADNTDSAAPVDETRAALHAGSEDFEGEAKAKTDEEERATEEGGKGGGGEPPDEDAPLGPEEANRRMEANIVPETKPGLNVLDMLNPDRLYRQFVTELGSSESIDNALTKNGQLDPSSQKTITDFVRQTYASDTRAGGMIRYGAVDPHTMRTLPDSPTVMGAAKMVKDAGGNVREWTNYMLAKRTVHKFDSQGIETGFDQKASREIIADPDMIAKYETATQHLNDAFTGILRYAQGKGLYTADQVDAMVRDNPTYLAMKRDMDGLPSFGGAGPKAGFRDPLKAMSGSDKQVVDPLTSTIRNVMQIVSAADRNDAAGALAKLTTVPELGIEKVSTTPDAEARDEAADPLNADALVQKGLGPNQFVWKHDGVAEVYSTKDPEVARLIRNADTPEEQNIVSKTLQVAASLERKGIVGNPLFPIMTQLRHTIQAFICDPVHPLPIATTLRGLPHVLAKDQVMQDWLAAGGGGASMVDMDTNFITKDINKIVGTNAETGVTGAIKNTVSGFLDAARLVQERMDASSRIGYTLTAMDKGFSHEKAVMMSREAMVDYHQRATLQLVNGMAKAVPFFRADILGNRQVVKAFMDRPVSTSIYALGALVLPTIALNIINQQQDQYLPKGQRWQDIQSWEKDSALILPSINGVRARIPLPPSLAPVFSGMTSRVMDYMAGKGGVDYHAWAADVLHHVIPPLSPTLLTPLMENYTNKDSNTGRPLVPASVEKLSGPLQYTDSTSMTARKLDSVLGPAWQSATGTQLSPIQLDNMVKGYGGLLGQQALASIDAPLKAREGIQELPKQWTENKFIASFFIRNPGLNSQSVESFYNDYKEFQTAHADFEEASKRAASGDPSGLQELAQKSTDPEAFIRLDGIVSALRTQRSLVTAVTNDKEMTVDEKRQQIDRLVEDSVSTAEAGNAAIKAVKSAKVASQAPADASQLMGTVQQ